MVQTGVKAGLRDEGAVGPSLDNRTVVEDEHEIGFTNGTQPMSNDKSRAATQQDLESLLQARFGYGVNRAGRFVEHNDPRVGQQSPGEADDLPLTKRKRRVAHSVNQRLFLKPRSHYQQCR